MHPVLFITGTDTGVGKTVFTTLLARHWRMRGLNVAAFKPLCSGGRADARSLHAALAGTMTLDEINPWHFRAPLAPLLAARRERKKVTLSQVAAHIRKHQKNFAVTLVEGAGGLLSPLGENFDSRDLLTALRAMPIVVATNKLGAVNHIRLTLEALTKEQRRQTWLVLMSPPKSDAAARTNAGLLAEFFPAERTLALPWLGKHFAIETVLKKSAVKKELSRLPGLR